MREGARCEPPVISRRNTLGRRQLRRRNLDSYRIAMSEHGLRQDLREDARVVPCTGVNAKLVEVPDNAEFELF